MKVPTLNLPAERLLPLTVYVVEANRFEELTLWQKYKERLDWRDANWGVLEHIGDLAGRPVMLSLKWHLLNGHPVLFIDPTSQVVDHVQIDAWLKAKVPAMQVDGCLPRCDAMNFHLCVHHVEELGVVEAQAEYAAA